MSPDFDDALRAALADETAAVTVPPFDAMLRRRRHRQVRRGAAVALAAVVAVAGVAFATPRERGDRLPPAATPSPRSHDELLDDPAAQAQVQACLERLGHRPGGELRWLVPPPGRGLRVHPALAPDLNRCLIESGFQGVTVPSDFTGSRDADELAAECQGLHDRLELTTTIGSGTYLGRPWSVHGARLADGSVCLLERYAGRANGHYHDTPGHSRSGPTTASAIVAGRLPGEFVFYGGVDPRARTVAGVVDGVEHRVPAVRVPGIEDRVFYAFAATVGRDDPDRFRYSITPLDPASRPIGEPDEGEVPLR